MCRAAKTALALLATLLPLGAAEAQHVRRAMRSGKRCAVF